MTSSGIEHANFVLVAQCLKPHVQTQQPHYPYGVPRVCLNFLPAYPLATLANLANPDRNMKHAVHSCVRCFERHMAELTAHTELDSSFTPASLG
jgi:hypothetical protein